MKLKPWLVGLMAAALLQAGAGYAYKTEVLVKADNQGDFVTLVAAVRQQMQPGGRYEFVDTHERETVETNLAAMQSLLDKYGTVAQMDMNTKIQLFNDQEIVNAILTRRDDKRLVCESVAPIGSHIPRTSCRTYREMELERRDVQNLKQQMLQVPAVRVPSGRPSSRGGNR